MSLFDHPRFLVLRHGQTSHNAADLIAGATDSPLTTLGHRQANAAALALSGVAIGQMHASPLIRAWITARAVADRRPDQKVTPAPDLAERNWGVWEGCPREMLDRDATPESGEGPAAFFARILRGCAAVPGPGADEAPPLIVAHSGTIRAICTALDLPFRRSPNCALTVFHRDRRGSWHADPPVLADHSFPNLTRIT